MTLTTEQQLARTQRELEDLKEEHKLFLYRISHDLNAPIRHIDGFSNLIMESNFHKFDDETKNYFRILMDSNLQLGAMMDALLRMSRLSTRQKPFELLDMDELVAFIISNELGGEIKNKSANLTVQPGLPKMHGDGEQIKILFVELLKNSLIYVSAEDIPQIQLTAQVNDGIIQFQIADNGIGVLPKLSKSIFEPFKRAVHKNAYPGQGIGLALVSKIVGRHNGKVWVEENSPAGSRFCIEFPA